jgi:molybdopterin-guanine dinucleotide biosynthesis protein A
MGRTKALVHVDGTPMARRVADTLFAAGCGSVTLVGGDPTELAVLGLPVVSDRHPGAGPLGGVITAIESAPGDVVVVACDLPYLTPDVVTSLVSAAKAHPTADVVVARTNFVEPGCALWRRRALPVVAESFDAGERAVHHLLDRLRSVEVAVPEYPLRNINAPGDLAR